MSLYILVRSDKLKISTRGSHKLFNSEKNDESSMVRILPIASQTLSKVIDKVTIIFPIRVAPSRTASDQNATVAVWPKTDQERTAPIGKKIIS